MKYPIEDFLADFDRFFRQSLIPLDGLPQDGVMKLLEMMFQARHPPSSAKERYAVFRTMMAVAQQYALSLGTATASTFAQAPESLLRAIHTLVVEQDRKEVSVEEIQALETGFRN